MPRKRRPRFNAAKTVRAIARERVGAPPPSRPIPDKRRRKTKKHKKDLLREQDD
jgi:hypothetical protein